jgi:hypothetical protein
VPEGLKSLAGSQVHKATLTKICYLSWYCYYRLNALTLRIQKSSHGAVHYSAQEDMSFSALRQLSQFQTCLRNYASRVPFGCQGVGAVPCVFRMGRFSCRVGWKLFSVCRRTSREHRVPKR